MPSIHRLINEIYQSKSIKYLELGIGCGRNFESLPIENKISVDICNKEKCGDWFGNPTHLMSTDDFFKINKDTFDIIFIDADHEYKQVIKDFNNSIKCLSDGGTIFLHDLYPPTEFHTNKQNCNNGFKFLNFLLDNNFELIVDLSDYGCVCVFDTKKNINVENIEDIEYSNFIKKYPSNLINNKFSINTNDFVEKYKNIKKI